MKPGSASHCLPGVVVPPPAAPLSLSLSAWHGGSWQASNRKGYNTTWTREREEAGTLAAWQAGMLPGLGGFRLYPLRMHVCEA